MDRLKTLANQLNVETNPEDQIILQRAISIESWWNTPRFRNVYRPYSAKQVAMMRGTIETDYFSNYMSKKFWDMATQLKQQKSYTVAYGALDPVQVVNASKYLQSVYVSGWQCSATASSTNEPGPDFADYPYDTVPKKCDQLVRALRMQDKKQNFERATMNDQERKQQIKYDYLVPLICDADAGFGGVTSTMKLIKLFIEAGAAGIHIEDQRAGTKKCGHMGGKVVISVQEHIQRLIACRLQADLMGSELVIIARTDALSAKLLDSNIDPIDHPYILGIVEGNKDPMTYPQAGILAIEQQIQLHRREQVKQLWLANCNKSGLYSAQKLAKKLGFILNFDWEKCRNCDGYYSVDGSIEWCAARAKEYLKYADALWMETSTPSLKDAELLSHYLKQELDDNKILTYNLSPSFNWSKFNFTDDQLQMFCSKLGSFGYSWQFITLAGFHLNALKSEKFSKDLSERTMLAYVEKIQRKESKHQVDQLLHQKWSGADYVDQLQMMINANSDTISQNEDSTENQFQTTLNYKKQPI